ncbi:unannotated protein [freshwater metagenome]|uniref:Unannotated protein n=1 Tax=freshwater metagenome TaxID=449393 RepID=A0A6J6G4Z1_9ZZZZ
MTGDPSTVTAAPVESNNDTVTPGTAVPAEPKDASPVRPDNVPPHCGPVGAVIVTTVDAGFNDAVLFEESVAVPDAFADMDDDDKPTIGPEPLGHATSVVGVKHN